MTVPMTTSMKRMAWLIGSAPLLLSVAWSATIGHGQDVKVNLDPAKSQVEFTLGGTLHTVHGTFQLKRGSMQFDPASGQAAGELVVDARSAESGNKSRDRRMHREILESEKYPEITFKPTHVEGHVNSAGPSQVQLAGIFNLHGADHQIELPASVQIAGSHLTGSAHFEVPYVQWGLKNPSTLFLRVSRQVAIDLHIDGYLTVVSKLP
jgi:polyisoprenoid-binding protein YceI